MLESAIAQSTRENNLTLTILKCSQMLAEIKTVSRTAMLSSLLNKFNATLLLEFHLFYRVELDLLTSLFSIGRNHIPILE